MAEGYLVGDWTLSTLVTGTAQVPSDGYAEWMSTVVNKLRIFKLVEG